MLDAIDRVPRIVICGHVHGGLRSGLSIRAFPIYNVSVVDEAYRLGNAPTVIELPDP
ncbi:MAG: hypothetical protein WBC51_02560 [Vicinamibacterales bacterium]